MRDLMAIVALLTALTPLACSRSESPGPPVPRYGAVMVELGRRFELAGRAANAGRFELAAFEAREIRELFDQDLPRAGPPKEGDASALFALAQAFRDSAPDRLKKAAEARDVAQFRAEFAAASVLCNDCHQSSGHGYIEVPSMPGKPVPDLDPVTDGGAR
jgi:hypothetical protein